MGRARGSRRGWGPRFAGVACVAASLGAVAAVAGDSLSSTLVSYPEVSTDLSLVSVGLSPGSDDVVSRGQVAPGFEGVGGERSGPALTRGSAEGVLDLYVTSSEDLVVNQFVLVSAEEPVCMPEVSHSGIMVAHPEDETRPVILIPGGAEGGIKLSVVPNCLGAGSTEVSVVIRAANRGKQGQTINKLVLNYVQECDEVTSFRGEAPSMVSVASSRDMLGPDPHPDVVRDGVSTPAYTFVGDPGAGDATVPVGLQVVDGDTDFARFYLAARGDRAVSLGHAVVEAKSDALRVSLSGPAYYPGVVAPGEEGGFGEATYLDLTFHCVGQPASIHVKVQVDVLEPEGTASFDLIKECKVGSSTPSSLHGVDYVATPGFHVYADAGFDANMGQLVVGDGLARGPWSPATARQELVSVPVHVSEATFHVVSGGQDPITFEAPVVTVRRTAILSAVVVGVLSDGGILVPGSEADLTLELACLKAGASIVEVNIPCHDAGSVRYSFLKECELHDDAMLARPEFGVDSSLGASLLLVGTTPIRQDVFDKGIPREPFALDPTDGNPARRHSFNSDARVAHFFLRSASGSIVLGTPVVTAYSEAQDGEDTVAIKLGGPASTEGLVSDKPKHLGIAFNCLRPGNATVTVHLATVNPKGLAVFGFTKICAGRDNVTEVTDASGVSVGTSPNESDVVSSGVSLWHGDDMEVPASAQAKTFYLHLPIEGKGKGADDHLFPLGVGIEETSVVSMDDSVLGCILSGQGSARGHLRPGRNVPLTVNFQCLRKGSTAVRVSVPVAEDGGTIKFGFIKHCSGSEPLAGMDARGLSVTALCLEGGACGQYYRGSVDDAYGYDDMQRTEMLALVDGFPTALFTKYKKGEIGDRVVVPPQERKAIFLVDRTGDHELGRPSIIAHRPICNPRLSGARADASDPRSDPRTEANELQVDFNCVWNGKTPVTVTIPVLPRNAISFTFTKECAVDKDTMGSTVIDGVEGAQHNFELDDWTEESWADNMGSRYYGDDADYYFDDYYAYDTAWEDWDDWDFDEEGVFSGKESREHEYDWWGDDYGDYADPFWDDDVNSFLWEDGEYFAGDYNDFGQVSAAVGAHSRLETYAGTINVGTQPVSADVVQSGFAQARYSIDENSAPSALITRPSQRFFVSVDEKMEVVGRPSARASNPSMVKASAVFVPETLPEGTAPDASRVTVTPQSPVAVSVKLTCLKDGVSPVLVSIPYGENNQAASFRVTKVCAGTNSSAVAMSTLAIVCVGSGALFFAGHRINAQTRAKKRRLREGDQEYRNVPHNE